MNAYLRSTGNHILDKISMSRCIDNSHMVGASFELAQRNIDGDTTFSGCFHLIHHPGVFERAFPHL